MRYSLNEIKKEIHLYINVVRGRFVICFGKPDFWETGGDGRNAKSDKKKEGLKNSYN